MALSTAPAHPWIKTGRSLLGAVVTTAVILPLAVNAAGIDVTEEGWRWLGVVLGVFVAVTRVMQVPQVNALLESTLRLGSKDVEAARVVALVEPSRPAAVLAGEAAPQPTGAVLAPSTTVSQLNTA